MFAAREPCLIHVGTAAGRKFTTLKTCWINGSQITGKIEKKKVLSSCYCHEIYRREAVGLNITIILDKL